MAIIKVKRAGNAGASLNYGELAIGNDELYFGNSSNLPIALMDLSTTQTVTAIKTFSAIPAFNGGDSATSAPFTVDSTFKVTDLNADLWDNYHFADYLDQAVKTTSKPTFIGMNITPDTENPSGNYINFRPNNTSYTTGVIYGTSGNECLSFVTKNSIASFQFVTGSDIANWNYATWNTITPTLQIKNKSVYINELISSGTSPLYTFSVNGTSNFTDVSTFKNRIILDYSAVGGDSTWLNSGILIKNMNGTPAETAIAMQNASTTASNYWIQGLNQSADYKFIYGASFADSLTKLMIKTNGDLITQINNSSISKIAQSGENVAGGNLTITSGQGTGNSATSSIIFQTPTVTGSGSTVQTLDTRLTIGQTSTTIANNLIVSGDLTVGGTTTTINATTISVDDKNIELGSVTTPTDTTADGGGITLKGATDKTITWKNISNGIGWHFNQDILPETDNTGAIGNSTYTWSNGQFTNLTVDTTLTASTINVSTAIDLSDNDILRFGSSDDWEFYHDGTNNYIDLNVGSLLIRDNTTTRFTFDRTTGNLTTAGKISAGELAIDNIKIDSNTISSTNSSGNINLYPNGAGTVSTNSAATTGSVLSAVGNSLTAGSVASFSSASTARTTGSRILTLSSSGTNVGDSVETLGLDVSVTNLGSSNTNIAIYSSASGGTSYNYSFFGASGILRNDGALRIGGGATISGIVNIIGDLAVDHIKIDLNTISSTDTNGNILLSPNGSGKVGIGLTPSYKLDINGDVNIASGSKYKINGANLAATDIGAEPTITTLPVSKGGTSATSFTVGRILFGNGTSALNTSTNLFWDNSNSRLGIGTTSPAESLAVAGNTKTQKMLISNTSNVSKYSIEYNSTEDSLDFIYV